MDNRLLKKFRKWAKNNIEIRPRGFEVTLEKEFGEEAPVYIYADNLGFYIHQNYCIDYKTLNAEIEGVKFFPDFTIGQYFSEDIPLREARKVLQKVRELYVRCQAEELRKKITRRKYKKEYNNFVKSLKEI